MSVGLARALAGVCAAVCAAVVSVAGAPAASAQSDDCAPPGELYLNVPWSQRLMAPERVWPFTRGGGVTVAVLATGVDAEHPLLEGRVEEGFDAVAGRGAADSDCLGLGTQVAGVIAARQDPNSGFAGLAPAARILPVRVVEGRPSRSYVAEAEDLAEGIRWAAERADVIVVAVAAYSDDDELAEAVREAVRAGALVVAAVGNLGQDSDGNPPPYPASYDGVIGVGAVDFTVTRWPRSQYGPYVDLVAPGADVVTLQRLGGMVATEGTGIAAGFVAGAAALVMSEYRDASASEVGHRLLATATPAPGGAWSPEYGRGVVNPYAAVHDRLVEADPTPLPAVIRPEPEEYPEWLRSREVAVAGALGALALVVVVITVAVALPRGNRRLWRAGIASLPPRVEEPEEPGPPLQLFDDKKPDET